MNDGFYRVLDVHAPLGTVTHAKWPGAVVGGWETHGRLVEVIFHALLEGFPERLMAGTKGMMCQAGFGSLDVETATYTCFYETFAGGYGGRKELDGPDAELHVGTAVVAAFEDLGPGVAVPAFELAR